MRDKGGSPNLVMRPYATTDYARVLEICITAFEPIHNGFEEALGSQIFRLQYHDWREQYAATVAGISTGDEGRRVYVAELGEKIAGFIFTTRKTGEIGLNAVDPSLQGLGIGRAMYTFALNDMKERGAEIAYVGTGADAAHGPAQRAYRAMGFDKAIPGLYLFKVL